MPKIIESVQETILTEAKEMLVKSDYDSFNIRDLSKKCSISVGTIYNYFPSKYELIHSVFIDDWDKVLKKINGINLEDRSFYEKLKAMYLEVDGFLEKYMRVFVQMASNIKRDKNSSKQALELLYPLINEMLDIEREKCTLTTKLPNDKLNRFIVNNLMLLCNDKTLTFDEVYSLMKL